VEGVLAPEEAKILQDQLAETTAKLTKLENKDFNFRRLENMTEEEKAKLTVTELGLKKQQEELETKQKEMESTFVGDIKGDLLSSLVGDDEELKKKVELNYSRIKESETAKTRAEIKAVLNDAYVMSVGIKGRNPINSAINASGAPAVKTEKLDDDVVSFGKKLGLSDEDLKNVK
jgi:hypothetical protein